MNRQLEITISVLALLTGIISGTVVVESRYAKASDLQVRLAGVQGQLNDYYARSLRLRILELQLKPAAEFTSADKALLEYMQQELREATHTR